MKSFLRRKSQAVFSRLYTAYFLGGLEILYEEFVQNCITDDDYIRKIFDYVGDFRDEQNTDDITVDIETLLGK